jgi:hypothetical protein
VQNRRSPLPIATPIGKDPRLAFPVCLPHPPLTYRSALRPFSLTTLYMALVAPVLR